MAAPANVTIENITGDWVMNKQLSNDIVPILELQGVPWILRKAIGIASITLHTKHTTDEKGIDHIDIEQTGTAGIKGTTEKRILDSEEREHEDYIFGHVKGRSRWVKLDDLKEEYLKKGWLPFPEKGAIESYVERMDESWTATQIWGFEEINGERRHARHVIVQSPQKKIEARLVYDYKPSK
jgi:hypothetical protein